VGPATTLYFLHSLLVRATNEPTSEIAHLMKTFTFTVVPTINPDGYVYSHDHQRLWRKNRQPVGQSSCVGESTPKLA
jgi:extracellular matrix protein 14